MQWSDFFVSFFGAYSRLFEVVWLYGGFKRIIKLLIIFPGDVTIYNMNINYLSSPSVDTPS